MQNYQINFENNWDYENGFYLSCATGRIGKFLNHLEIYKKILQLPRDILEFGVYKGASLMRLLAFRELLENTSSRKIIAFDAFGKFPNKLSLNSDVNFVENFEKIGGYGISMEHLNECIIKKGFTNYELIKGDINNTLPEWLSINQQKRFSLIHIDVDVYEPSLTILKKTWDKLIPGGILMLDDWGTVEGETRAVEEFFNGKYHIRKPNFYHIPSYIIKE